MILLLVRHGNAAREAEGKPLRLTHLGKSEAAAAGAFLRGKALPPPLLWHSPKPRAVETAKILVQEAGWEGLVVEEKAQLAPGGDEEKIYRDLTAERPDCLVLVSHQPFLEKLAYRLHQEMGRPLDLEFPTAGIQAFRFDGGWEWLWAYPSTNHSRAK